MPSPLRRHWFIVSTAIVAPIGFLLIIEGVLAVAGYRSPFADEDPYLGFSESSPLFEQSVSAGRPVFVTRERKLRWFNRQEFLVSKPGNGFRIFTFGGSTTFGRPYGDPTSFSGWLRATLSAGDSSHRYEVVNVGGVSYASYRVVRLMQEMAEYKPDLFVVYTGNNEFLEDRTYSAIKDEIPVLRSVRENLQQLRVYGLVREILSPLGEDGRDDRPRVGGDVEAILDQSVGIDRYKRDPDKADQIYTHFRSNLNRMADIAEELDIPLLLIVPSTNEKDFSPFKSSFAQPSGPEDAEHWHRRFDEAGRMQSEGRHAEAGVLLNALASETPEHAGLRYRRGISLFELGNLQGAKKEFVAARDEDIAPLRATSTIQQIVKEVAADRGLPLIDLQSELEQRSLAQLGHECLGNAFFYDHCHPTIGIHQMLAERIRTEAGKIDGIPRSLAAFPSPEKEFYDSLMAEQAPEYFTARDLNLAKVLRWAGKKREAEVFVRNAVARLSDHPEAWYLFGLTLSEKGDLDSASIAMTRAVSLDPDNARGYNSLGSIALRMGDPERAVHLYQEAIRRDPELDGVNYNLGNALVRMGEVEGGIQAYRRELAQNPDNTLALNNLGFLHLNRGEFDIAGPLFEKTIALDPQNIEAISNLGIVSAAGGDLDRAEQMFRQVLSISPGDRFALDWLSRLKQARAEAP